MWFGDDAHRRREVWPYRLGIELDPLYVDVAIRRWQKLTKRHAVNAETGLTFAETEERMHALNGTGDFAMVRDETMP